jgi:hypothetical protein
MKEVVAFDLLKVAAVRSDQVEAPVLSLAFLEGDPFASGRPGGILVAGRIARELAKTGAIRSDDEQVAYSVGVLRDEDEVPSAG